MEKARPQESLREFPVGQRTARPAPDLRVAGLRRAGFMAGEIPHHDGIVGNRRLPHAECDDGTSARRGAAVPEGKQSKTTHQVCEMFVFATTAMAAGCLPVIEAAALAIRSL